MAKLLGGSQIYGNATVNSYLVVSGNADLSGGNVTIGSGNVTVTSIIPSNFGTGYTTNPTITVSAPTTLYGGTATANANLGVYGTPTISNGGTGYAVNNVLTMVGTANAVSNATFTVTSVSGGVITGITVTTPGVYFSSNATSPVTVTGGTGTGATLTVAYGVNTPTVTYGGTGYVEQPTITITGGGGTGATAYSVVGPTQARLQTLANSINFQLPSGGGLVLQDDTSGGSPQTYPTPGTLFITGTKSTLGRMGIKSSGALFLSTASSNGMYFNTGASTTLGQDGRTQLLIVDTASSTNYVQITGAAAGAGATVSVAGTDTNIDLNLSGKGTGNTKTTGNLVVGGNLFVAGNLTTLNYETILYTETANTMVVTGNTVLGTNASSLLGSTMSGIALQGQLQTYNYVGSDSTFATTVMALPKVFNIVTVDGVVPRNLIGKSSNGDINIGQNFTAYIGSIQLNAGSAATSQVKFVTGSTGQYTSNFDNAGNLNVAGNLVVGTAGTAIYAANLITANGLYWANGTSFATSVVSGLATYSNSNVQAYLTSAATGVTANLGNIITTNGVYWANGAAYSTGASNFFSSNIIANASTASTSANTGAIIVPYGGMGVAGNIFVGGNLVGTYTNVTITSGAFTTTFDPYGNVTIANGSGNLVAGNVNAAFIGNLGAKLIGDGSGITNVAASQLAGTAQTANVSIQSQINPSTSSGVFYPTFSNIQTGNSILSTSTTLQYQPSSGNLNATNFVGSLYGTVQTPIQGQIIQFGNLINLSVGNGSILQGNVVANSNAQANSAVTGAIIVPNGGMGVAGNIFVGSQLRAGTITSGNANVNMYADGITGNIAVGTTTSNVYITGNLVNPGNIYSNIIITNNGVFWPNGVSFATSVISGIAVYSNANVAAYLTQGVPGNININNGSGIYWTANGLPYGYGNTNVLSYLQSGSIANVRLGNAFIQGNLTVANVLFTNQEIITLTDLVQGNLTANANTVTSFGSTIGALSAPYGGIYAGGNIVAGQAIATTSGFYWAGNGQVYGYSNTAAAAYLTSGATTVNANLGNVITANGVYWANGVSFTAGFTNFGNANVGAYLTTYAGNISAANYYWSGNGNSLYGNTDMAGYAYRFFMPNFTGNFQAGNILVSTTNGQSGNISAANVLSGGYFWSNGAPFITSNYGNANVAAYLPTFQGLVNSGRLQSFGNANIGGNLFVTGDTFHTGNIAVSSLATQSNVVVISGISYQNTNLTFTATPFAPIANSAVVFSGSFGSFTSGTTYYVLSGATTTAMTVSTTPGGSAFNSGQPVLTAATGVTGTLTTIYSVPTPSYNPTSGALVLTGGVGIGGNLNVGGQTALGNGVNLYNTGGSVLNITGNTFGDGGGNSGANALVYISQTNSWNGNQPWSLYVTGYSYLNGFRINGQDSPRALHKAINGNLGFSTSDATSGITFGPQNGTTAFAVYPPASGASTVNYLQVTGGASGNSPTISALGGNVNIDIVLQAQGNGNITTANTVRFTSANTSTSTSTGALVVTGGIGAGGNIYANAFYTVSGLYWAGNNNVINVGSTGGNPTGASGQIQYNQGGSLAAANLLYYSGNNTVVSNSGVSSANTTSGAFQVVGGMGVTGNVWAGNIWSTSLYTGSGVFWSGNLQPIYLGNVLSANNLIFTNSTTNTLQVNGGANIGNLLTVGNTITASGNIVAASGVSSTNTTTGALVVVGGAGVSGNLNIGGNVTVGGNIIPTANVTYNLGSPTQRFASLYLSGNTIYIGSATISASAGSMTLTTDTGGSFSVTGSIAGQGTGTFGNLLANSGVASNGTNSGALQVVGGAGITGNVNAGGNITVTNFLTTGANITSQGNIIGSNFLFNNGAAITAGFVTSNFTGNMTVGNVTQGNIKTGVAIDGQDKTFYVAKNGNDSNNGKFNSPFLTIKAALAAAATAGAGTAWTVQVAPGTYTEANPITIPTNVSLMGNDIRTVTIIPQTPTNDLFYVTSGCYVWGVTIKNYQANGFSYSSSTSSQNVFISPYIQNLTSSTTSTTACAVMIDGNYSSAISTKAMIVGFFTIINQGGYGIRLKNSGYSQLVNIYTLGCEVGVWSESGSFCTLNGSDNGVGNVGLRADGYGPLLCAANTYGYSTNGIFNIRNYTSQPHVNQIMIINGDTNYYNIDTLTQVDAQTWQVQIQETYTGNLAPNTNIAFYQRSAVVASAHTFEYVGAGTILANALPQYGGLPNANLKVIQTGGGRVTYTGTDEKGNFYIGSNLVVNQGTGTISGDSFNRSMFALMTPYILALEV